MFTFFSMTMPFFSFSLSSRPCLVSQFNFCHKCRCIINMNSNIWYICTHLVYIVGNSTFGSFFVYWMWLLFEISIVVNVVSTFILSSFALCSECNLQRAYSLPYIHIGSFIHTHTDVIICASFKEARVRYLIHNVTLFS